MTEIHWITTEATYAYLRTPTGGANVQSLGTHWRWECHSQEDFGLDMDGWWGICNTEDCAKQCAETWLKRYGEIS